MTSTDRMRICSIVALAALALHWPVERAAAQSAHDPETARTAPLDRRLPAAPALAAGVLDNGMSYYVRENSEPANRAFLRLVVDAGSLQERDGERGLAHFLEHMAFNGTERFEKQELIAYMESIGMQLGPGVNARTSFDETVYMLSVPTDAPENVATAFAIMEDWTRALTLDPAEIEQERGVVTEEWRSGQGAGSRVRDRHLPVLFHGSRYAERLPIGTPESIAAVDREALARFYRDWYRPDLMAAVAVGDFDASRIEDLIRRHFADLPASSAGANERVEHDVPAHEQTLFSVVADPEVPRASVEVHYKAEPDDDWTLGGFRERLVERLYDSLLNLRFQEIAREPDAPFLAASSQTTRPIRASALHSLTAAVAEDGIERGLGALVTESARVARFGFTESELERGKRMMLRAMERRYANRDNRHSARLASAYTQAYLTGRPTPGIRYENALYARFVPGISLTEVNAAGRRRLEDSSRVVLVTAPEKEGLTLPDEAALTAVLNEAAEAEIERYVDTVGDGVLLDEVPEGSPVVATRKRAGGLTEWDLANGARVVLKPTDFDEDQVVFRGFSPGGMSHASDEHFAAARTAVPAIAGGGIADLDATALQKALAGKIASVNAFIAEGEEGVAGSASNRDLQTMFELIYLRYTAPRADENAFEVLKSQLQFVLRNRENDPAVAFGDAFNRLMTRDHPRARPMTAGTTEEMDLERSLAFYRDRFADASDATFVFVGAFALETMRPLVERYIGALPATGSEEAWRDHGMRLPEGVVEETVHKGLEPRSRTRIAFNGELDMDNQAQRTLLVATARLLQTHLRDVLREELGGTYSVAVNERLRWLPAETYALVIEFGSDPERADELAARILDEIAELERDGPSAEDVADTAEGMLRAHETDMERNGYWLRALSDSYRHESTPGAGSLLAYRGTVEDLTPARIREAMTRYLDPERYVRVTLMPEQR